LNSFRALSLLLPRFLHLSDRVGFTFFGRMRTPLNHPSIRVSEKRGELQQIGPLYRTLVANVCRQS
jgi:hypothetical protein